MRPAVWRVLVATADVYHLDLEEIWSRSREAELVRARHAATWIMRERLGASWNEIARALKRGDHTTPMAAHKRADKRAETCDEFAIELATIWRRAQTAATCEALDAEGARVLH